MATPRKTVTDLPADFDPYTTDVAAIEANANTRLDAYRSRMALRQAPAWRPTPGTTMFGVVVGLAMQDSGYGMYPVIKYKLESGDIVAVHAFHTLLRNRLAELKTTLGSEHYITYLGKRQKNNATDDEKEKGLDAYHNYDVEDAKQEATISEAGVPEDFAF